MTNSENPQVVSSSRPIRERVGLIVDGANAAAAVKTIVAAEDAGVRQIWVAQPQAYLEAKFVTIFQMSYNFNARE